MLVTLNIRATELVMYILYANPLSTYCAKVRAVLRHKNIVYEERSPPDGYGSEAYRAIVPMGTIPGFVASDVVLSESEAICEYLEESHPFPSMMPVGIAARAMARALARIHDCWVEPQIRALYLHLNTHTRNNALATKHAEALHQRLHEFAAYAAPEPFLCGSHLSIADCAWPTTLMQTRLALESLRIPFSLPQALAPWLSALNEHAAIAPGLDACEREMRAWLRRVNTKP